MSRRRTAQPDLLDWQPPTPVVAFEPAQVRAASLAASVARAVAATLRDSPLPREEVGARMSAYLGERVSKHMLDAYASEQRTDHPIPVTRLVALMHATGDRRLLQLIAEPLGWAVIERRHLPMIELAAVQEQRDELARRADALRRAARAGGAM
ncbi:DNA transposition protein [Roseomonas sp. HJA6]|uniref:DNA transposition protein n=1 Tax=Roseomonas alba TaxID=2846776 RepID=A0ABS7ACR0_9PROT|nr:DNA transposition protein [Neoroseomonas alba]MBW6399527.1 DNA transposition protein [Neoroseomonas alba]